MIGKKEKAEFTKLVILNTAKKLFVEKGYFNTSIRDIAKEADLSTGAVYHHFGSKEEIASVIYRETLDRIKDLIQSAIREGGTTKERIRNLVKKLFYMAEKDRYTMEYALYIKHREIIDTPICSSEPYEIIKDWLTEEMNNKSIKLADGDMLAILFTGTIIRFMQLRWDDIIKESLESYSDKVAEFLWELLRR